MQDISRITTNSCSLEYQLGDRQSPRGSKTLIHAQVVVELNIPCRRIDKAPLGETFCSANYILHRIGQVPLLVGTLWPRQPQPIMTWPIRPSAPGTTGPDAIAHCSGVCRASGRSPDYTSLEPEQQHTSASPALIHMHDVPSEIPSHILSVYSESCSAFYTKVASFLLWHQDDKCVTGAGMIYVGGTSRPLQIPCEPLHSLIIVTPPSRALAY